MIRKITSDSSHFFHRIFKMQKGGWEGIFEGGEGVVILLYYITFLQILVLHRFSLYLYDFLLCRWHEFRTLCDSQRRINVVLELSTNLPDEEVLDRWLAEPIKCVMVSTNLFLTNKRGYPVLSKPHQNFLKKLFKVHILFIICFTLHKLVLGGGGDIGICMLCPSVLLSIFL